MSRSPGARPLTTVLPILISPDVGLSRPGEQSQRGALPAPRRPDEDEELPVGHGQVETVERDHAARVTPRDVTELDFCHVQPFSPVLATDCTK